MRSNDKKEEKEKAIKLRLKGLSYSEIKKKIGTPKSTLSYWLKNVEISEEKQERINKRAREKSRKALIKRNKLQTKKAKERAKENRKKGRNKINNISKEKLIMIGTSLYWAEGYKRPIIKNGKEKTTHSISLTNTDPDLINIFIKFLEDICNIPKKNITARVRIYEHMNEEKVLKYWQKKTKIPKKNFKKSSYGVSLSSKRKRGFNRLPYGTIKIRVNNTNKFHQIMGMIDGLKEEISN